MKPAILPSNILTVVIRDDSPMVNCGDSPTYRSVRIELTPDQVDKLALNKIFMSGGIAYYEIISKCFIEPNTDHLK